MAKITTKNVIDLRDRVDNKKEGNMYLSDYIPVRVIGMDGVTRVGLYSMKDLDDGVDRGNDNKVTAEQVCTKGPGFFARLFGCK